MLLLAVSFRFSGAPENVFTYLWTDSFHVIDYEAFRILYRGDRNVHGPLRTCRVRKSDEVKSGDVGVSSPVLLPTNIIYKC
jgi:hypothetical protein